MKNKLLKVASHWAANVGNLSEFQNYEKVTNPLKSHWTVCLWLRRHVATFRTASFCQSHPAQLTKLYSWLSTLLCCPPPPTLYPSRQTAPHLWFNLFEDAIGMKMGRLNQFNNNYYWSPVWFLPLDVCLGCFLSEESSSAPEKVQGSRHPLF